MARLARIILPGYPHLITQRGNRRQDVFFCKEDFGFYLDLLKEWCEQESIQIWAYCLVTNHVHLMVNPDECSNLSRAIGETHRRYTRMINRRERWCGYLWQGRFSSFPMDDSWLLAAVAYIEYNPVVTGMVAQPWDYRWSSVHAHLEGKDPHGIVDVKPWFGWTGNWKKYLSNYRTSTGDRLATHERSGRPLGNEGFIDKLESQLGREVRKKKPGPKPQRALMYYVPKISSRALEKE